MKYTALNENFNFQTKDMGHLRKVFRNEIKNKQIEYDVSIPTESNIQDIVGDQNINQNHDKPPSFLNRNATMCWLNSLVQFLLLTIKENDSKSLLKQQLLNYTLNSNLPKSTVDLRKDLSLRSPNLRFGQQDPFDFFVALEGFPPSEKESILLPLSIYTKTLMSCNNDSSHSCIGYSQTPDPYVTVNIPTDNTLIQSVIEQEFNDETLIMDWKCNRCGHMGGTKKKFVQDTLLPDFILVKLKRYDISMTGQIYKVNRAVSPPLGFTLKTDESLSHPYSLNGVLTHIGTQVTSGHYISEIKKGDDWWKCNDNSVSSTTFENLSKQAYAFLFKKL
jgi:ubiquitin C-terminal hydrolase